MSSADSLDTKIAADDTTSVTITGNGIHGVNFLPDSAGFGALVGSWDRSSGDKFGPVQMHGGVHLGDFLCAVNDIQVEWVPYLEVMSIVNDRTISNKVLKFAGKYHRYRSK